MADLVMACGGCGSTNLATQPVGGTTYGLCLECDRLQEVEHRCEPDREMCDNCAFRPGSPERADPWGWMRLMEGVEEGIPFHCHKGLPLQLGADKTEVVRFEMRPDEMRRCAGWTAHRKAHERRLETEGEQP